MFDQVASIGFNSDYLCELSICECWLIYYNKIENARIANYCQYPKDKNGNDIQYNQLYQWLIN